MSQQRLSIHVPVHLSPEDLGRRRPFAPTQPPTQWTRLRAWARLVCYQPSSLVSDRASSCGVCSYGPLESPDGTLIVTPEGPGLPMSTVCLCSVVCHWKNCLRCWPGLGSPPTKTGEEEGARSSPGHLQGLNRWPATRWKERVVMTHGGRSENCPGERRLLCDLGSPWARRTRNRGPWSILPG